MANVVLSNVKKSYGQADVIHGVDLDIADREFVVFVGPSGCGKSTLLRMIAGLEDITAGELAIDGQTMNETAPADRGIAMVFQSYALYPHKTVRDNIGFGLRMAKVDKAEIARKVDGAARILGLEKLLDRRPKDLSGGQRQRVAIGRAIVREPRLFLFDEPLSNLDAALRGQMRIEIARLHQDLKATMIYVTHDQVEAMTLADKIVVLNAGRIEQVGSPMELYENPANLFVAGFIGSPHMNMLSGTVSSLGTNEITLRLESGTDVRVPVAVPASVAVGDRITLGLRPEDCRFGDDLLRIPVEVLVVERLGAQTHVIARTQGASSATVASEADQVAFVLDGRASVAPGDKLTIGAPGDRCYLFDDAGRALIRRTMTANTTADERHAS